MHIRNLILAATILTLGPAAFAKTLYVDDDGLGNDSNTGLLMTQPKRTIQAALDLAVAGDLVLVADGTYNEGGKAVGGYALPNRVAIPDGVTLRSINGKAMTFIEGIGPSGPGAVRCAYVGAGAVLSGFTLRNGATLDTGAFFQEMGGGGVYCETSSIVENCTLTSNEAFTGGGSLGGTLNNCELLNNFARNWGGGSRESTLNNCTLSGNIAELQGGGAYGGTLNDCTLENNLADEEGGGAVTSELNRCVIVGNTAPFLGGGVYSCTVSNSLILRNKVTAIIGIGGGAAVSSLTGCTVVQNTAEDIGGGTFQCIIVNSIVYFNTAYSSTNAIPDTENNFDSVISYSCTFPLPQDPANSISSDPLFVDFAGGNFRLSPDSPCVDRGDNSRIAGPTDIDGLPRLLDGDQDFVATVDMGYSERAAKADLSGLNLSGLNLRHCDLSGANLTGANFSDTDLTGANLRGSNLTDTILDATDFSEANLDGVISRGISGTPAELPTDWMLIGGYLIGPGAFLTGANLEGLDLADAILTGVRSGGITGNPLALPANWLLMDGYLMGPGADLTGAYLSGLDLTGVDLTGAILAGVASAGITGTPSALPAGWILLNGFLMGPEADLSGVDLSGMDISGADLTGAIVDGANFLGSYMVVDTLADELNTGSSDGTGISLREALRDAPAGIEIRFDSALESGIITLGGQPLVIDTDILIDGSNLDGGIGISGNGASRVFIVQEGITVSMISLTISGGKAPDGITDNNGLGLQGSHGGGIHNSGTLLLSECSLLSNRAGNGGVTTTPDATGNGRVGGSGGHGGGIYNTTTGVIHLENCYLKGNSAGSGYRGSSVGLGIPEIDEYEGWYTGGNGGNGGHGGGIFSSGTLQVISSTVHQNSAGKGGEGSSGSSGRNYRYEWPKGGNGGSGGSGGGIYNGASGTSEIFINTFFENASGLGGERGSPGCDCFPDAEQYYVYPDSGVGGNGGAIQNLGILHLTASTITANVAASGGTAARAGYGGGIHTTGSLTPQSSLIARNFARSGGANPDISGKVNTLGYNLVGISNGSSGWDAQAGDLIGISASPIDPLLEALANNGGPTLTVALKPTSPALENGDPSMDGTDQRGFPRPSRGGVDIGAYEELAFAPDIIVEHPMDSVLVDGSSVIDIGLLALGASTDLVFKITNWDEVDQDLEGIIVSVEGVNPGDVSIIQIPAEILSPGESSEFTVAFSPLVHGVRSALLRVASNDQDESPFDIKITAYGYRQGDTDEDGLSNFDELTIHRTNPDLPDTDGDGAKDGTEINLASIGFLNGTDDSELVALLQGNASGLGLYDSSDISTAYLQGQQEVIDDPNRFDLFNLSEGQVFRGSIPVIAMDPVTGKVVLTMDWQISDDFSTFMDFPANGPGTTVSINPDGDIKFEFDSPGGAGFFRVLMHP